MQLQPLQALTCGNLSKAHEITVFVRRKMLRSMQCAVAGGELVNLALAERGRTLVDIAEYLTVTLGADSVVDSSISAGAGVAQVPGSGSIQIAAPTKSKGVNARFNFSNFFVVNNARPVYIFYVSNICF